MNLRKLVRAAAVSIGGLGGFVAVLLMVVAVQDLPTRAALRHRVGQLDERYLGGALHRVRSGRAALPPANVPAPHGAGAYAWLPADRFLAIAHGLGPMYLAGPNSMATFEAALAQGFTFFEVDLVLTTDGRIVCFHGSSDEELQRLTGGEYDSLMRTRGTAPCRFADLVRAARSHPDIHFILDPKNRVPEIYDRARQEIGDPAVGHQFIPQIYDPSQAAAVRRGDFFAGEIFTSYRSSFGTPQMLDWARRADVRAVTLTLQRAADLGALPTQPAILVHPVDEPSTAVALRLAGARGIYSYYLSPRLAPALYAPWTAECRPPLRFACGEAGPPHR
jgi:glycerophosphoryl diester phosphodiesterase